MKGNLYLKTTTVTVRIKKNSTDYSTHAVASNLMYITAVKCMTVSVLPVSFPHAIISQFTAAAIMCLTKLFVALHKRLREDSISISKEENGCF